MKKAFIFILFLVCLSTIFSCQKDLGNYVYADINEVKIEGVDSLYAIDLEDTLSITPTLSFLTNADTSLFAFEWYYGGPQGMLSTGGNLLHVGPTLRMSLSYLSPGMHDLYFLVTEKSTGLRYTKTFQVFLNIIGYEGWLILSAIDEQPRLDMISYAGGFYVPYLNILDTLASTVALEGTPISVNLSMINYGSQIYVVTSTEGYILDPNTYQNHWMATPYSALISNNRGTDYSDSKSYLNFFTDYIYSNGDAYMRTIDTSPFNTTGPINTVNNVRFNMAPFIAATSDWTNPRAIFFNEDNNTMYRYEGNGGTTSNPIIIEGLAMEDFDLVYMDYVSRGSGTVCALFRDINTQSFHLAQFDMNGRLLDLDEVNGPDIEQAEHFTLSPEWNYLLYAVAGNVYEFDAGSGETTLKISNPGEQITYLSYPKFLFPNYPGLSTNEDRYRQYNRELIVCTYDESNPNTSGKMLRYEIPPVNQPFILLESHEGFGKIVSVVYNEK